MIIKIHNPQKAVGGNTGSSLNLVQYLDKENRDLEELDKTHFFNKDGKDFSAASVERDIDNNKGRLSKDETKFYMLTVNPSKEELEHINSDESLFRLYINKVMDGYADNFDRNFKDGSKLKGDDLMYYAKIEHERTYKHNEPQYRDKMSHNYKVQKSINTLEKKLDNSLQNSTKKDSIKINNEILKKREEFIRNSNGTIIKEGALKDGNNMHAHIIISRYDKSQKMKLSPMSNHKHSQNIIKGKKVTIGFNRDEFVKNSEVLFDKTFDFKREYQKSYNYYKEAKQIRQLSNLLHLRNPEAFAKMATKKAMMDMIKNKELQKNLGYAMNPKKIPKKIIKKLEKEAVKAVLKSMEATAYTNPVTAGIQVAKQVISIASKIMYKTIEKGMGI